jgi:SulP family sulfate permease
MKKMSMPSKVTVPAKSSAELPMDEPPAQSWLWRRVPALDVLRTYSLSSLGRDAAAGLTVATVAVPQAMAYAALAGLPPQYGLYTAIVMTAVGAILDSSRLLINGPTNAIAIALLSALTLVPEEHRVPAAILLSMMVGIIQLVMALLRFGNLARYVSPAVVIGFTAGAATLLVLDQTRHLLGLAPRGNAGDHFLTRFWLTLTAGEGIHPATVLVAAGTIAVIVLVRQLNIALRARGARFPIPQHLVAIIIMGSLVWAMRLDEAGVQVVGAVPGGLPTLQMPPWNWDHCRILAGNALAIALLGLMEALAMAKAIAARTGQPLDVNQQCISEGAANLAGSFFQCFPGSGSLTRSAVNHQAGAVSQWSGVFAALFVAGAVVVAAPLAYFIPRASLAGILVLAAYRMVDNRQLVRLLRSSKVDAVVLIVTAVSAVLISIEFCILIGVVFSAVLSKRAEKV